MCPSCLSSQFLPVFRVPCFVQLGDLLLHGRGRAGGVRPHGQSSAGSDGRTTGPPRPGEQRVVPVPVTGPLTGGARVGEPSASALLLPAAGRLAPRRLQRHRPARQRLLFGGCLSTLCVLALALGVSWGRGFSGQPYSLSYLSVGGKSYPHKAFTWNTPLVTFNLY